jgi:hypothetical protein
MIINLSRTNIGNKGKKGGGKMLLEFMLKKLETHFIDERNRFYEISNNNF